MTRPALRLVAVAAATCSVVAVAAPAFADASSSVGVSVKSLGGTRQFAVENVSGAPLSAINLGLGGAQPFRTHVTDAGFTSLTSGYAVGATMSNLYLKNANGSHNYAATIPSKDVSLGYGTTPLSALGLSLADLPKISLTSFPTCTSLSSTVQDTLGLVGGVIPVADIPLTQACAALDKLSLASEAAPVTATVDGVLQTITPLLNSVLDLPTALSGATPGSFTSPDFGAGTVGAADPAKTSAAPTSLQIMTGVPGLSAGALTAIQNALDSVLKGLPLVGATGVPAQTTADAVINGLSTSTNALVSDLGTKLATLPAGEQLTLINSLLSAVLPAKLADLASVSGQYFGFPILHADSKDAPVAGTYDGTMTVTFVQK